MTLPIPVGRKSHIMGDKHRVSMKDNNSEKCLRVVLAICMGKAVFLVNHYYQLSSP